MPRYTRWLTGGPILNPRHIVRGTQSSSSAGLAIPASEDLLQKQTLSERVYVAEKNLTRFRLVVIFVNTLIYAATVKKADSIPWLAFATIALAGVYGLLIYLLEPHRRYPVLQSSYLTSAADAVLIVSWMIATGGVQSPFYATFYLSMVAISFRYSTMETVVAGVIYSGTYLILALVSDSTHFKMDLIVVRLTYIPLAGMLGAVISREMFEQTEAKVKLQEQIHTDERIKESEIRVAEAQQMAALGSWEWNVRSNELKWSDQLYRMFGLDPKLLSVTYQAYLDRVHPDDRERVRIAFEQARTDLQPFSFEHRIIRENGEVRTLAARGQVIVGPFNRPQKIIGTEQDITERKRADERLHHLANHDVLTGLPNRTLVNDRITQALARPRWHNRHVAVLFVNLDRFKLVNDSLGHATGDALLKAVAQRLFACVREGDTVGRLGADEFVILLSDIAQQEDAGMVAQKILTKLADPIAVEHHEIFVTASIGVSVFPDDGADAEMLLRNAAVSMSRAKEQGKNNYQHYSPTMNSKSAKRLALETSLRRALERQEFLLHYQPIIDLARQQIVSMEALLRWKHPDLGLVSPGEFIPLAEETGLIVPIGEWVLHTACEQNKQWQRAGIPPVCVAVNLSARQFHQQSMIETVSRALQITGLEAQWLELELTESIMMSNAEASIATLIALNKMGVRLALDDFGTGYSSLSYLKRFPITTLKIDQAFVRNISTDQNDRAIASAIVTLGHSLNLAVLAEAVETSEQLELLRLLRCDQVQGYFFSRPLPAEDATRLLVERRKINALSTVGKSPEASGQAGPERV